MSYTRRVGSRKLGTSLLVLAAGLSMFWVHKSEAQSNARLTVLNSMERIEPHQPLFGAPAAEIKAAKNEVESFQVVVGADGGTLQVMNAELSDFTGPAGRIGSENAELFREEYARVRRSTPEAETPPGLYADPLVPFVNPETGQPIEPYRETRERWGDPIKKTGHLMFATPFEVWDGQNQPIWVDVAVPADAAAGDYEATFTVALEGGETASVPVRLTVWDFALPDGPSHSNHFGGVRRVARAFDVEPESDEYRQIERRYLQMMADHRINPALPHSLLPEVNEDGSLAVDPERHAALTRFMKDLHVTDFEIPRFPIGRRSETPTVNREKAKRYYSDYYDYVKANGWADRAYLYMYDEPNLSENYEEVLALAEVVHEAAPDMRVLVVEQPYKHDPSWPDIDPAVDIWSPLWAFIDRDAVNRVIAGGDEVWSYTALVQDAPEYHPKYEEVKDYDPPYWHIDRALSNYRVPTWLNYQYNISGLLYWTMVQNTELDPWHAPNFPHGSRGSHFNGGGLLIYPGGETGIRGPVASMRLKNIRDGMEDYEYFVLLEELAGRDAVMEIVDEIAPEWWEVSRDPNAIQSARERLAREILARKS